MILEIDAGNTRVKWRLLQISGTGPRRVAGRGIMATGEGDAILEELAQCWGKLPGGQVERVRVSNVRGNGFKTDLSALVEGKWRLQPEYAVVERSRGLIVSSYLELSALGVDRWLAMLAAWQKSQDACVVLDCGSAITLDRVDARGRHLGGYIVPGFHLMREALAGKSEALKRALSTGNFSAPAGSSRMTKKIPVPEAANSGGDAGSAAADTVAAINEGLLAMALGFAERIHREDRDVQGQCRWHLTGGDAALLSRHLSWAHEVSPELVLDGLGVALP